MRYGGIKGNTPVKLKISPVAMTQNKSWEFRTILDLSFRLKQNGQLMDSVKSTTTKQAPTESMIKLGPWVKILMATLVGKYNHNKPQRFAKIDIKDAF